MSKQQGGVAAIMESATGLLPLLAAAPGGSLQVHMPLAMASGVTR